MPQAYYEDQQHLRYVGSFKRQFSEQEARSLRQRTRLKPGATEVNLPAAITQKQLGDIRCVSDRNLTG